MLDMREEACFLVGFEPVGEGGGVDSGTVGQQDADYRERRPHRDGACATTRFVAACLL